MGFYLNKSPFFLFNNPQRTTATGTMVKLDNPNLDVNNDTWYHLGLNACDEIKENFSDVTYVCVGGKEKNASLRRVPVQAARPAEELPLRRGRPHAEEPLRSRPALRHVQGRAGADREPRHGPADHLHSLA